MTEPAERTLIDYLSLAAEFLTGKGVDGARLDAELMLAEVLSMDRVSLYTSYDRSLAPAEIDAFRSLLRRRGAREPLAYILGRREFRSVDFAVDRRVLIPRPESELLVEMAARLVQGPANGNGLRLADVGTGSGVLAVCMALEIPDARVLASDLSASALELAPENARRHGVEDRIDFVRGDCLEPLAGQGPFAVVVSNPPYVRDDQWQGLMPEVARWEPRLALAGGVEGMDMVGRLIEGVPGVLEPEGWLVLECGTQAHEVGQLMEQAAWREVSIEPDLAGLDRVVSGRRPAG